MKAVLMEGQKFEALIDMGSDNKFIKEAAVPFGAIRQPRVRRLQGFGDSVVESKKCILSEFVWGTLMKI